MAGRQVGIILVLKRRQAWRDRVPGCLTQNWWSRSIGGSFGSGSKAFAMAWEERKTEGTKARKEGLRAWRERGSCGLGATMLSACLCVPVESPLGILKRSVPHIYFSVF